MSDQMDLDRIVGDWLRADVPVRAPRGVLVGALERAADTRQDRRLSTPSFDAWLIRSPWLHRAVVLAVAAAALIGLVAGVGAMLRRSPGPLPAVTNGAVVFVAGPATRQSPSDLYLAGDGSDELLVDGSSNGIRIDCPAFSPDGTRLAYSERPIGTIGTADGHGTVIITDVDGSGRPSGTAIRLPVATSRAICPKWAPDGRKVGWVANGLWIGRPDGSSERVDGWDVVGDAYDFDWSPDGTMLVSGGADQSTTVSIVPVDGGPARVLARSGSHADFGEAKWSPDATMVAVVQNTFRDEPDVGRTMVGSTVQVYRADGSGDPIELPGGDSLAWSPGGHRLAYVRPVSHDGSDRSEIVTVSLDTLETRFVAQGDIVDAIRGLAWSPDGKQLMFVRDRGVLGGMWTVSSDGESPPTVITQLPHYLEFTNSQQITWQPLLP